VDVYRLKLGESLTLCSLSTGPPQAHRHFYASNYTAEDHCWNMHISFPCVLHLVRSMWPASVGFIDSGFVALANCCHHCPTTWLVRPCSSDGNHSFCQSLAVLAIGPLSPEEGRALLHTCGSAGAGNECRKLQLGESPYWKRHGPCEMCCVPQGSSGELVVIPVIFPLWLKFKVTNWCLFQMTKTLEKCMISDKVFLY
jgi:hypothetical protein